MKIDHYAIEVADLDSAINFYAKFGFKLQCRLVDEREHEALAILELDGGRLELIQVLSECNQPRPYQPPALRPHFCPHVALQTDELATALSMILSEGLVLVHGPIEMPGAARWVYLRDADYNVIEIFEDLSV